MTAPGTGRLDCNQLDHFDGYAAGYWDGSRVRVLRPEAGRDPQVFTGSVKRYVRSD